MKSKNYLPFFTGMAAMALLISIITASFATESTDKSAQTEENPTIWVTTSEHPAGDVSGKALTCVYDNHTGLALFGKKQMEAGQSDIPVVLTYVDEDGMAHEYVSAEAISTLLNMSGVTYNAELHCVDFGTRAWSRTLSAEELTALQEEGLSEEEYTEAYEELTGGTMSCEPSYQESRIARNGEEIITQVGYGPRSITRQLDDVSISVGTERADDTHRQAYMKKLRETPTQAETGIQIGALTEVDTSEIDPANSLGYFMNQDRFSSFNEVNCTLNFAPIPDTYALVTIENCGEDDSIVHLRLPYTIGEWNDTQFSAIRVPAGQSIQRVFRIDALDGGIDLLTRLSLTASSIDDTKETSIRLSAEQYGSAEYFQRIDTLMSAK